MIWSIVVWDALLCGWLKLTVFRRNLLHPAQDGGIIFIQELVYSYQSTHGVISQKTLFFVSKNTSLMQLISVYYTYSKSLHVSGRTLPIIRRI